MALPFSIFEPLTTQNNEGMFPSYVQQKNFV